MKTVKILSIKKRSVILAAIMLLSILGAGKVGADGFRSEDLKKGVDHGKVETLYVSPHDAKKYNEWYEVLFPLSKNIPAGKIKNIRSSNKKVLEVTDVYNEKVGNKKAVLMDVWVKKTGSATVSFRYGSKTYRVKYVVKKFTNGLKSVKLGGIAGDYATRFDSHLWYEKELKKTPDNIRLKTRPNWRIQEVSFVSEAAPDWKTVFKNKKGTTDVTVKDRAFRPSMEVQIQCYNVKTGEEEVYTLGLSKRIKI